VTDVWGDDRDKAAGATRLSTTHNGYVGRALYSGMDGRQVHLLKPSRVDTFTYDDGPFHPAESAAPAYCDVLWGVGESSFCDITGGGFSLHSDRYVHSLVTLTTDDWGNTQEVDDYGHVLEPGDQSVDGIVRSKQVWKPVSGDTAHWMW